MDSSVTSPIPSPRAASDQTPDVAVVGAGPAGCATALAYARAGARVLLLEANPKASQRLAGEWLHPTGTAALQRLGVDLPSAAFPGHGFAVFPDDGTTPVLLPYSGEALGLSCEHDALVARLREAASAQPTVCYVPDGRVIAIDGERLTYEDRARARSTTVLPERIVGADGRSSIVRQALGAVARPIALSHMAGVVLDDVDLAHEGFGHVFLGGPGPALAYRIGARQARLCLDVPGRLPRPSEAAAHLWTGYGAVLPPTLLPAFRAALQHGRIQWAANQFCARLQYGCGRLALVGDACGRFHPLTAAGMALGLLDAEALAASPSVAAYRRQRIANTLVPEVLALALYRLFVMNDSGSAALRRGMYRVWRENPNERANTMRLLSGDETGLLPFGRSFMRVMAQALVEITREGTAQGHWRESAREIKSCLSWLMWLAARASRRNSLASPP